MKKQFDYRQMKKNFIIGAICFVIGVICAVGAHLHAQSLDIGRLLFYDVSDVRVYAFVISLLAGFVLMGIPFIKLNFVKNLFLLDFYLISNNANLLDEVEKSGADSFLFMSKDENGNYREKEKSKFTLVLQCILGIILLIVGGLVLYAIGIVASVFILVVQLILLIKNRNNQ